MSAKTFFQGLLGTQPIPRGPKASDLYSGPRAFSGYQPGAANAGRQYDDVSRQALQQLGQVSQTGFTDADRAAQAQSQRQANRAEAAQRGAVMQQAQARGQLNSGNAFLGNLMAQQQGAARAQDAATNLQVQGQQRRIGATQAAAGIGQQLSAQDMQRAGAADQFNQWASGMQANAQQQAYDNAMTRYQQQQQNANEWWDRISGMAGMGGGA